MKDCLDISLAIGPEYVSWPGFESFELTNITSVSEEFEYFLTKVTMLTQTGTHVDAPSHYIKDGKGIEAIPFSLFIGRAKVLDLSTVQGNFITAMHCIRDGEWPQRVLLKTRASSAWNSKCFPQDYPVLEKEAVEYLFNKGVRVLATDTPSVDEFTSKSPRVHLWLAERDIYIMESAYLYEAQEGYYELIALPLNIQGADGSPVRAILRNLT